ncbi:MAG: hypothetical protein ABSE68_02925, partial [Minisyncoccia bacterium]
MNKKTAIISIIISFAMVGNALAFNGPTAGQNPGSGGGLIFASSTKIGIGTANPVTQLDVYGGTGPVQLSVRAGDDGKSNLNFYSNGIRKGIVGYSS